MNLGPQTADINMDNWKGVNFHQMCHFLNYYYQIKLVKKKMNFKLSVIAINIKL